ncbi:MAG TPA: hypothetical protein DHI91_01485 [Candidatus Portnoybacteria bacterium]|nr:hypothetical protein [Candidatus Portnoybacteria bacterium]
MDILAHGLWAGAAGRTVNLKKKNPLKIWRMVFWGVLPDFFSFTPVFVWLFGSLLFGGKGLADFPRPDETEPMAPDTLPIFQLTNMLYNISHSLAIFLAVAGLIVFFVRRVPWEVGGWLVHILIDIPSHSYKFYPTPFLWPFSEWKFDGWSWGAPIFMIINYSLIIGVYVLFYFVNKKRKKYVN